MDVSFMSRPLHLKGTKPWYLLDRRVGMDPTDSLDVMEKTKSLAPDRNLIFIPWWSSQ
jgi:hypothetical protein